MQDMNGINCLQRYLLNLAGNQTAHAKECGCILRMGFLCISVCNSVWNFVIHNNHQRYLLNVSIYLSIDR